MAMLGDDFKTTTTEEWSFVAVGKDTGTKLVDKWGHLPSPRVKLFAIANEKGVFVAVGDKHVVSGKLEDLEAAIDKSLHEVTEITSTEISSPVNMVEFASDEASVAICHAKGGVKVYSLELNELCCVESKCVRDIQSRPRCSSEFAILDEEGGLHMLDVTSGEFRQIASDVVSFSWSQMGAQLLAGKSTSGSLVQLKPNGDTVIEIPKPNKEEVVPVFVVWLENTTVLAFYSSSEGPENFEYAAYMGQRKATSSPEITWRQIEDPVPAIGDLTRTFSVYFQCIRNWSEKAPLTLLLSAGPSTDINLLTKNEIFTFKDDQSRATFPMTDEMEDVGPVGMAVDFSHNRVLPRLLALTSEGNIVAWDLQWKEALYNNANLNGVRERHSKMIEAAVTSEATKAPASRQNSTAFTPSGSFGSTGSFGNAAAMPTFGQSKGFGQSAIPRFGSPSQTIFGNGAQSSFLASNLDSSTSNEHKNDDTASKAVNAFDQRTDSTPPPFSQTTGFGGKGGFGQTSAFSAISSAERSSEIPKSDSDDIKPKGFATERMREPVTQIADSDEEYKDANVSEEEDNEALNNDSELDIGSVGELNLNTDDSAIKFSDLSTVEPASVPSPVFGTFGNASVTKPVIGSFTSSRNGSSLFSSPKPPGTPVDNKAEVKEVPSNTLLGEEPKVVFEESAVTNGSNEVDHASPTKAIKEEQSLEGSGHTSPVPSPVLASPSISTLDPGLSESSGLDNSISRTETLANDGEPTLVTPANEPDKNEVESNVTQPVDNGEARSEEVDRSKSVEAESADYDDTEANDALSRSHDKDNSLNSDRDEDVEDVSSDKSPVMQKLPNKVVHDDKTALVIPEVSTDELADQSVDSDAKTPTSAKSGDEWDDVKHDLKRAAESEGSGVIVGSMDSSFISLDDRHKSRLKEDELEPDTDIKSQHDLREDVSDQPGIGEYGEQASEQPDVDQDLDATLETRSEEEDALFDDDIDEYVNDEPTPTDEPYEDFEEEAIKDKNSNIQPEFLPFIAQSADLPDEVYDSIDSDFDLYYLETNARFKIANTNARNLGRVVAWNAADTEISHDLGDLFQLESWRLSDVTTISYLIEKLLSDLAPSNERISSDTSKVENLKKSLGSVALRMSRLQELIRYKSGELNERALRMRSLPVNAVELQRKLRQSAAKLEGELSSIELEINVIKSQISKYGSSQAPSIPGIRDSIGRITQLACKKQSVVRDLVLELRGSAQDIYTPLQTPMKSSSGAEVTTVSLQSAYRERVMDEIDFLSKHSGSKFKLSVGTLLRNRSAQDILH